MGKFEKVEVVAKQVGQNYNVVIGDKKVTIKGTTEELQPVKDAVKSYLDKPSATTLKSLEAFFKSEKEVKKFLLEKAKDKVEEIKKIGSTKKAVIKKASETAEEKDLKEVKQEVKRVPEPVAQKGYGRRGEY